MNSVSKRLTNYSYIALILLFFSHAALAEKITIRADRNDFPATYILEDSWQGMDIDIIKEIFLRSELDYRIVSMPFKRSLIQIQDGTIHVIPNLVKNDERSEYMHWLGPMRVTCIGLVVQKKDLALPIESTDDLIKVALKENKKVGYLTGASYSETFDHRLEHDAHLNDVLYFLPDKEQYFNMLKLGRVLGYFHDAFEIQQRMTDQHFAEQYSELALHSYRIEDSCTGAYIGISKKLDDISYLKIKTAFKTMRDDGSFEKIYLKWLEKKPDFKSDH